MNIKKRIRNSPSILTVLGAIIGGMWFSWTGAIIGGVTGFILDTTLGYNAKPTNEESIQKQDLTGAK